MKRLSRFIAGCALALVPLFLFCEKAVAAEGGVQYLNKDKLVLTLDAREFGPAGFSGATLWVSSDEGKTWQKVGQYDLNGKIIFTAPGDGLYFFRSQARDKAGNEEPQPTGGIAPDARIVVDTKPPAVKVVRPAGGESFTPEDTVEVAWEGDDPFGINTESAELFFSKDNGTSWEKIAAKPSGNIFKLFAPAEAVENARFKVSARDRAGNAATSAPSREFSIVPQAAKISGVTAPVMTNALLFDIEYSLKKNTIGQSGIGKVEVWFTKDEGRSWELYGHDTDLQSPAQFRAPGEGLFGFQIVAVNRAGLAANRPVAGTKPAASTMVDFTAPTVVLESPRGGEFFRGGQVVEVKYIYRDANPAEKPITVFASKDGAKTWEEAGKELKANGIFEWKAPLENGSLFRLKVSARDAVGNESSAASNNFVVDSTIPEVENVKVVGKEIPGVKVVDTPGPVLGPGPEPAPQPVEKEKPVPPAGLSDEGKKNLQRHLDRGYAHLTAGKFEQAVAEFDAALAIMPDNADARLNRGKALSRLGRDDKAVEEFKALLAKSPNDFEARYNLALLYKKSGRFNDAREQFAACVALKPASYEGWMRLAHACIAEGDLKGAREAFEKILEISDNTDAAGLAQAKKDVEKYLSEMK